MEVVEVEAEQGVKRLEKGWSSTFVMLVALGVVFPEKRWTKKVAVPVLEGASSVRQ